MTGVGGRPEVILEGGDSASGPWKKYQFQYKPGKLHGTPPFVGKLNTIPFKFHNSRTAINVECIVTKPAPHQPRLDWQMWFAALGTYQQSPWLMHLVYRILTNETDVLALLGRNPFPEQPPKFMRANLYHYHFTKLGSTNRK